MSNKISIYIRLKNYKNVNVIWSVKDGVLYQLINPTTALTYKFDNVFYLEKNHDIFTCIVSIVDDFLNNKSGTIFAYGQTGSGKTHTMLGTQDEPGIIFSTLAYILKSSKIHLSYIEIYNEKVNDLIDPSKKIKIYSTALNTPIIPTENTTYSYISSVNNVTKREIKNIEEARRLIQICEMRRKTRETEFNKQSSRSHTIISIYKDDSILNLIDLAGSEKASVNKDRIMEGKYINKSLLALGTVINKLINNEYVNYRDSNLTRILQPCLEFGGNVVSLCMINENLSESLNTLKFAGRLGKVVLKEKKIEEVREGECGCPCCMKHKNHKEKKNEELSFGVKNKMDSNDVDQICVLKNDNLVLKRENMILKSENDLLSDRIKNLEDTIHNLMIQNPSKRTNDLFVLEKNMFNLQMEMIKRKKEKSEK